MLLLSRIVAAQTATLRVTVVDPSDAVIVGAHVDVRSRSGAVQPVTHETSATGDATFALLEPGRYSIHVESPGFAPADVKDVRLRAGETTRTVKLAIAAIADRVDVGRDARERASDPRGDAFATVLGQAEINELPDDPDQLEQMLNDMAGPGAVMRVNGFRGGRLPPKDQIAQIRFRRNMFAADTHEPGVIAVDIITKPGLDSWRGTTGIGFRSSALAEKNAFAPVKGDERYERGNLSLSGPLWPKRTSLSLSIDGTNAFDSKTVVAALPSGAFADSVRRPSDALNATARIEHGLTATQVLRGEVQRNHTFNDRLGVGDFDLIDRAYQQRVDDTVLRASLSGSLSKGLFNEFRAQWRATETASTPASLAPAVLVLNAFNTGGAQIDGARRDTTVQVSDDLDIVWGRHAIRTGFLLETEDYRTAERRNTTGTFTFADLGAYALGQPLIFTRNTGDPDVSVSQVQAGIYIQDDYRASKSLTISGGLRQERQSRIGGFPLGPRGSIAWSPFRNGKTTVRAGAGVFFDWFDAQTYAQAVQLDGRHQQIETIVQPGYPDPAAGGHSLLLPNGRVQIDGALTQPTLKEMTGGVEQQLPGGLRAGAMVIHRRGSSLLRGVNLNAPDANGVRPDPTAGTITDIQSTAGSVFDALAVNLNFARPDKRVFVALNYMLSRTLNDTDSPFSVAADAHNLAAERGPALTDARHRAMGFANVPLFGDFTLGTAFRVQSGLPYNITTGFDNNHDTIVNDRPVGVTRNTGRGTATIDVSARVSWKHGFGGPATSAGTPQVRIVRAGADSNPLGDMPSGPNQSRYAIELYVQAFNALNHVNALNFSGVETSPFFGQATSAGSPRRFELGARLTF